MLSIKKQDIYNSDNINIGKKYIFSGEIRYGTSPENIRMLQKEIAEIKEQSLSEVIVLDFLKLKRWDSLGINQIVSPILSINDDLKKRGRILIGIICDTATDIYATAKDKYPDLSNETLPWYGSHEDFLKEVEEG